MDSTELPFTLDAPAPAAHVQVTAAGLQAVDLFCGAGGLSYAFHRSGFRIAAAVEMNKNAAASYRTSFVDRHSPTTRLLQHDIRNREVVEALNALRSDGVTIDIVVGGPPCQDFSPARLKLRRNGARATLVEQYFAILELLRPRAFLFENVPGLLTAGDGRYWRTVRKHAAALGYEIYAEVLHAEAFGVPQRRHRLFVVGLQRELGPFVFPRGTGQPAPTVGDTIRQLTPLCACRGSRRDPMHRARNHSHEIVEYLKHIKQGGAWRQAKDKRVLPAHLRHNGHYDVYGRMTYDGIAPTITGGCTNPSKGRFIHPTQHRGLTVREAALLQTFPADWMFVGGIEAASQQVGNAVPVRLGEALAKALRECLVPAP